MKKKIFLMLAVMAMLVCVFAISVNAENRTSISYTDASGVTHNVSVVKYADATAEAVTAAIKAGDNRGHQCSVSGTTRVMDNGAYAIVMDDEGDLTAYPSWYIFDIVGDESNAEVCEVGYGYLNSVSGKEYSDGAARYIEFPNGLTAMRNNNVFGGTGSVYETNVTHMYIPASVTTMKKSSLAGAASLKYVYIAENSQMTTIADEALSKANKLEYFQFENLSLLTEIDGFNDCSALCCDVDLSKCTNLKTIGSKAFYNTNIGKITLPDSVESIGDSAFENTNNAYLASPYLPASLTSIGTKFFAGNTNLLEAYVFPVGFKTIGSEPFQDSTVADGPTGKKLDLIFLGKVTSCVYLNGNGHQKHAEKVTVYFAQNSLSDYNTNGFYIKPSNSSLTSVPGAIRAVFCDGTGGGANGSVTGIESVYITSTAGTSWTSDMVNDESNGFDFDNHTHYGACTLVPNTCGSDGSETIACIVCDKEYLTTLEATGDHNYVEGVCTACGHSLCPGGAEHSMVLVISYASGYASVGEIANVCQNENCTHKEVVEEASAIFTYVGYSAKINGDKITVGYLVNQEALKAYQDNTGKTLSYGVVACKADGEQNTPISVDNGTLNIGDKVIKAELKDTYSAFDFILTGFTSNYYGTPLVMCAYIYDGSDVCYINKGSCDAFASAVTFDSEAEE